MGSIPNGSAPLQACARQIFKSNASGPHREGASFMVICDDIDESLYIILIPLS